MVQPPHSTAKRVRGLFLTEFYTRLTAANKLFDNRILSHTDTLTLVVLINGQPVGRMRHDEGNKRTGMHLMMVPDPLFLFGAIPSYSPDSRVIPWGRRKQEGQ